LEIRGSYLNVDAMDRQVRQWATRHVARHHTAYPLRLQNAVYMRYMRVKNRRQGLNHRARLRSTSKEVRLDRCEILQCSRKQTDGAAQHTGVLASSYSNWANRRPKRVTNLEMCHMPLANPSKLCRMEISRASAAGTHHAQAEKLPWNCRTARLAVQALKHACKQHASRITRFICS
jgi:hypothetical protein